MCWYSQLSDLTTCTVQMQSQSYVNIINIRKLKHIKTHNESSKVSVHCCIYTNIIDFGLYTNIIDFGQRESDNQQFCIRIPVYRVLY